MEVILVGMILGAFLLGANSYNDEEMKAIVESMKKHLSKMATMEKRLAVVEQQQGKSSSTLN